MQPIDSLDGLKGRVERLVAGPSRRSARALCTASSGGQLSFQLPTPIGREPTIGLPRQNLSTFLDFLLGAVPTGDVYLFGGALRDMALMGRDGFDSDIDLVIDGDWDNCLRYLEHAGARKNKFGGYRLNVAGWPIDIWNARETWAIREGLVRYRGVESLTETTVLNWDAILMNWRTRNFICRPNYVEELRNRVLDIVLRENPDPLGMVVRVLRHLCLKDARKITVGAAEYLAAAVRKYDFDEIRRREVKSYGNAVVEHPIFRLFEHYGFATGFDSRGRFGIASETLRVELDL